MWGVGCCHGDTDVVPLAWCSVYFQYVLCGWVVKPQECCVFPFTPWPIAISSSPFTYLHLLLLSGTSAALRPPKPGKGSLMYTHLHTLSLPLPLSLSWGIQEPSKVTLLHCQCKSRSNMARKVFKQKLRLECLHAELGLKVTTTSHDHYSYT